MMIFVLVGSSYNSEEDNYNSWVVENVFTSRDKVIDYITTNMSSIFKEYDEYEFVGNNGVRLRKNNGDELHYMIYARELV